MSAPTRRRALLGTALVLSLAATGWLGAEEHGSADVAEAVAARPRDTAPADAGARASQAAELRLDPTQRPAGAEPARDLFAATSWRAQEAPAKALPPPPPSAPPLPFAYLGKMNYDGAVTVFLSHQDRNLAVREGEVIDGSWRVDSIKGALLTLTYLPLDTRETMHIGDPN